MRLFVFLQCCKTPLYVHSLDKVSVLIARYMFLLYVSARYMFLLYVSASGKKKSQRYSQKIA